MGWDPANWKRMCRAKMGAGPMGPLPVTFLNDRVTVLSYKIPQGLAVLYINSSRSSGELTTSPGHF